jgi:Protein of unknown function (DUF2384)
MQTPAQAPVPTPAAGASTVNLNDPAACAEISAASFRAFLHTAQYLDLSVGDRCRILGNLPAATYHRWVDRGAATLSRDLLERISLVLGIVKALRLLFATDDSGKRWLKSANRDAPFGGDTPLARMLRGSIADLYEVRRYLDAWRGAWP